MEHLEALTKQIIQQVTQNITQQFQLQLTSLGLSQQNNVVEPIVNCVSTIGSCIDSYPSRKNNHIDTHKLCELYVDIDPPLLVAIGKCTI